MSNYGEYSQEHYPYYEPTDNAMSAIESSSGPNGQIRAPQGMDRFHQPPPKAYSEMGKYQHYHHQQHQRPNGGQLMNYGQQAMLSQQQSMSQHHLAGYGQQQQQQSNNSWVHQNQLIEQQNRIGFLERKIHQLESDNQLVMQQNNQQRVQFTSALDVIANKLVAAMVEQQIGVDQAPFQPATTTSGTKRSKGILKATNSPKQCAYMIEATVPTEQPTAFVSMTSQSETLIRDYLAEEQANQDALNYQQQYQPQPQPPMSSYDYSQMIPRPAMAQANGGASLSPKPPSIKSPRWHGAKKSVRFPHYPNSTTTKSAPPNHQQHHRSDEESEVEEESDHLSTDNSSQESDREQMGNASFLNDLKMISEDKEHQQKKIASSTSSPTGRHAAYQPNNRTKLNRKDSTHSLSSEPNKSDGFRRDNKYGMSINSLNRFPRSGVERVLSSCSNESSNMSPRTVEGTPTSMKAIREMNGETTPRKFNKDNKKPENKKKKKSLFSKEIFNLKQKFTSKKSSQDGEVRVGTPEGEWRFNQSLSPQKQPPPSESLTRKSLA